MAPRGTSTLALARSEPAEVDVFGEFELDVQVTTDASTGYTMRRCDTNDTCGSTCASACVSN